MSERREGQRDPAAKRGEAVSRRMERARVYFREHHANVEPDADFARRVAERLTREPVEILGWAAVRLLPASLVLALALAWFSFGPVSGTEAVSTEAASDDVLLWLLEEPETGP